MQTRIKIDLTLPNAVKFIPKGEICVYAPQQMSGHICNKTVFTAIFNDMAVPVIALCTGTGKETSRLILFSIKKY